MKLALGTVQFGMRYGVANTQGQVTPEAIAAILRVARQAGIDTIDTAIAYGDAEARLGDAGIHDFRVISKLSRLGDDRGGIAREVHSALARLRIASLDGLLLHRSGDLCGNDASATHAALLALKAAGLVRRIGVSIYDPRELDAIVPRFDIDLVQAPFNVLDRRLETSGWLARLKQAGIEVHTRSALLQGLLVMNAETRPAQFARWSGLWKRWDYWIADTGASPLAASIGFALAQPAIDRVVIGVDSASQLQDILAAVAGRPPIPPADLATDDTDLINPAMWSPN